MQAGLVVETGEAREVHDVALLVGYGAAAVNPYLALDTVAQLVAEGRLPAEMTREEAQKRAVKGIAKGLLKMMSKMGISTVQSYRGAQIFEAVGLEPRARRQAFHRHAVAHRRHRDRRARPRGARPARARVPGQRRRAPARRRPLRLAPRGEHHKWNPETIATLQDAVRGGGCETFEEYSRSCRTRRTRAATRCAGCSSSATPTTADPARRGRAGRGDREAVRHRRDVVRLDQRRGARDARDRDEPDRRPQSNSGEGGEEPQRFEPDENGDSRRTAIKQVASGRFGVTTHYLANADDLQIKIAQGAKPGEGGQLPGHKVDERHRRRARSDARRRR